MGDFSQHVLEKNLHVYYGNVGCLVSKGGIQNLIIFSAKIQYTQRIFSKEIIALCEWQSSRIGNHFRK